MTQRWTIENPDVAAVFNAYPDDVKTKLMFLRELILDVAAKTEGAGELEETLKWGQPSYLTSKSKSGSLIRIDRIKSQDGTYAMYFHCQTTLIDTFKEMHRGIFRFEGNRGIIFNINDPLPVDALRHCVSMALTYHLDKKRGKARHEVKCSPRAAQKPRALKR